MRFWINQIILSEINHLHKWSKSQYLIYLVTYLSSTLGYLSTHLSEIMLSWMKFIQKNIKNQCSSDSLSHKFSHFHKNSRQNRESKSKVLSCFNLCHICWGNICLIRWDPWLVLTYRSALERLAGWLELKCTVTARHPAQGWGSQARWWPGTSGRALWCG